MNIFEYLGLPAGHRIEDKIFQLVKHWREVNKVEGKLHAKLKGKKYAVQVKKDGVFAAVVRTIGGTAIFSRTGRRFTNVEHLEAKLHGQLNLGVYMCELCSELCSLEELSGTVSPNRVKELDEQQTLIKYSLHLFVHDSLSLGEFIRGGTDLPWDERYLRSCTSIKPCDQISVIPYIPTASVEHVFDIADEYIKQGEEGIVIKPLETPYLCGAKDWHAMKIVRDVDYDLECIGIEEGTGKYAGHVANLLFRWKGGKTIKAMLGKGWSMVNARDMYLHHHGLIRHTSAFNPVGNIYRVYALQESSKGVLRLPKVGEHRWDKPKADF